MPGKRSVPARPGHCPRPPPACRPSQPLFEPLAPPPPPTTPPARIAVVPQGYHEGDCWQDLQVCRTRACARRGDVLRWPARLHVPRGLRQLRRDAAREPERGRGGVHGRRGVRRRDDGLRRSICCFIQLRLHHARRHHAVLVTAFGLWSRRDVVAQVDYPTYHLPPTVRRCLERHVRGGGLPDDYGQRTVRQRCRSAQLRDHVALDLGDGRRVLLR